MHEIQHTFGHTSYTLREFENFLSPEECRSLIEYAQSRLVKSLVYEAAADQPDDKARISDQTWIYDTEQHPVVDAINQRIHALIQIPPDRYEALQVVRYNPGGFYRPHHDACVGTPSECRRMNDRFQSQRYLTFLIYLNDDFSGGGTHFPTLKFTTHPKQGRAVLFVNTDTSGKVLPDSLHGGDPVHVGQKWICNKWIHYPQPQPDYADYATVERFVPTPHTKTFVWLTLSVVIMVLGVRWWFVH